MTINAKPTELEIAARRYAALGDTPLSLIAAMFSEASVNALQRSLFTKANQDASIAAQAATASQTGLPSPR